MKCPKCGFTGFDYLDSCKRCGGDLRDTRSLLQIIAVSPDERAGSGVAAPAPSPAAVPEARGAPAAVDFSELDPEPLAAPEGQAMLEDLDFDQSFADMVEPTGHAAAKREVAEDDALLDLDFGDVFGEKDGKDA